MVVVRVGCGGGEGGVSGGVRVTSRPHPQDRDELQEHTNGGERSVGLPEDQSPCLL